MIFAKTSMMIVCLGTALLLTGCFGSEADKRQLFSDMYQRGLEERHCDMLEKELQARADCWKEKDVKWKGVPSAYVGEPPEGVVRSTKKYSGDDGPKVPQLRW
jgi:hypothetical protein